MRIKILLFILIVFNVSFLNAFNADQGQLTQDHSIDRYEISKSKAYEVDALLTNDGKIICTWMEDRDKSSMQRKQLRDVRVCYSISSDNGKSWGTKQIVDFPNTMITANPQLEMDDQGNVYLVVMSVNENFFSSKLVLLKFNDEQSIFEIQSYPRISPTTLLDKPSIVFIGDTLNICYVEYPSPPTKSLAVFQQSLDKGQTWSDPIYLDSKENTMPLGISMKKQNNRLMMSIGSHLLDKVYFAQEDIAKVDARQPFSEISSIAEGLVSGMTELEVGGDRTVLISNQKNHRISELFLLYSSDSGKTWLPPSLVDKKGFLLSTSVANNGTIHTTYFRSEHDSLSFIYKRISLNKSGKLEDCSISVLSTEENNYDGYIGAFQKILLDDSGNIYLFWIDYASDNKLSVSIIKE